VIFPELMQNAALSLIKAVSTVILFCAVYAALHAYAVFTAAQGIKQDPRRHYNG